MSDEITIAIILVGVIAIALVWAYALHVLGSGGSAMADDPAFW